MNEALLQRVVAGDVLAWHSLWKAVEPTVWHITGRWQLVGQLSKRDDDRRNIVVDVMHRLQDDGHRRIRAFLAAEPSAAKSSFKAWLVTMTTRAAIDYLRAHPEFDAARGRAGEARWFKVVPMSDPDGRSTVADAPSKAAVSELLDRARRDLRNDQLRALSLWLEGGTHLEIEQELGLRDAGAGERLVRSALKKLRDRFAPGHDTLIEGTRDHLRETT